MLDADNRRRDRHTGPDLVVAVGIGFFADRIAEAVDEVDVVPGAAFHGIITETAGQRVIADTANERIVAGGTIKDIVAVVPGNRVVERIAGAIEIPGAGQRQVVDIGLGRQAPG